MNDQANVVNTVGVNTSKATLLQELKHETGTVRRQDLLKALWKLNRTPKTQSGLQAATASDIGEKAPSPMSNARVLQILNQLYATVKFSLAGYLRYAKPWAARTDEHLLEAIQHIADEQNESLDRVGSRIIERRGHVVGGSFPMRFTAFNDLSVAYLAPRVMKDQERIMREMKSRMSQLTSDPTAHALAMDLLGAALAHRDSLREVIDGRKYDTSQKAITRMSDDVCQNSTPAVATAA